MKRDSADGLGTQLRRLLEMLDGDLEALYRKQHDFYVPRYTPVMKALADGAQLTIKDIAGRSSISHSAASQTISKMADLGLVELALEDDRRSKSVRLSTKGRALLPWLRSCWQATEQAADALDRELSFPLSQLLAEAVSQLEAIPFSDRISAQARGDGTQ